MSESNDCITARRATLRDCNSNNHISADGKLKAATLIEGLDGIRCIPNGNLSNGPNRYLHVLSDVDIKRRYLGRLD